MRQAVIHCGVSVFSEGSY